MKPNTENLKKTSTSNYRPSNLPKGVQHGLILDLPVSLFPDTFGRLPMESFAIAAL
jgi:hypothetical protein